MYTKFGSAEQQDFSDNSEFAFESSAVFKAVRQLQLFNKNDKDN